MAGTVIYLQNYTSGIELDQPRSFRRFKSTFNSKVARVFLYTLQKGTLCECTLMPLDSGYVQPSKFPILPSECSDFPTSYLQHECHGISTTWRQACGQRHWPTLKRGHRERLWQLCHHGRRPQDARFHLWYRSHQSGSLPSKRNKSSPNSGRQTYPWADQHSLSKILP